RLEQAESVYRHQQGILTTRAGDIVTGLRVLAGVGGRGLFARRYEGRARAPPGGGDRGGAGEGWVGAVAVVVSRLLPAAVVWLAARMAAQGQITIGEMIAVYGYVAILIVPVWFLMAGGYDVIRGRVAARRIIAILSLTPDEVGARGAAPAPERPADLYD